jgi:phage terminase small subunit
MADRLTVKQEKYVQGLFAGLTQREAYKQAFNCTNMLDKTVDETACKLASDRKIITRLNELQEEFKNRNMVTVERVLAEYAKLGFFDPRKLFNADGSPKNIIDLDDETAAAVAGLDVQEAYEGSGEMREFVGYVKKYKLTDKKGALDSMAKYLGMFKEEVKLTGGLDNTNKVTINTDPEQLRKEIDEMIIQRNAEIDEMIIQRNAAQNGNS